MDRVTVEGQIGDNDWYSPGEPEIAIEDPWETEPVG